MSEARLKAIVFGVGSSRGILCVTGVEDKIFQPLIEGGEPDDETLTQILWVSIVRPGRRDWNSGGNTMIQTY